MIFLGCAGWAYNHWRGPFYPSALASELEFYAQYSPLNEINSTFYRIPSGKPIRHVKELSLLLIQKDLLNS